MDFPRPFGGLRVHQPKLKFVVARINMPLSCYILNDRPPAKRAPIRVQIFFSLKILAKK
jgi:hypothetical protein